MPDCRALLISAPASGQGKTTVTAALARRARNEGLSVCCFKTGADFLDPMVLERASGTACRQLDLWMVGEQDCARQLASAARDHDLLLVEGVMGLFDGTPSSADLAQRFGLPVLAVIDGSAMAQTFGAVAHGLAQYREGLTVHGVLANRVGGDYHADLLRQSLPASMAFVGHLPGTSELSLPERHLGLVQAAELEDFDSKLDAGAEALRAMAPFDTLPVVSFDAVPGVPVEPLLQGRRIAIARDAAHAFIYPANLDTLRALGAELLFFSPLAGEPLPDCDAAWLPGGYPELHAKALSANSALRSSLHVHVDSGRALLAECGGMMSLFETLVDGDGLSHPMHGLLPGRVRMLPRLAALGLQAIDLGHGELRGHSFHHSQCETSLEPAAWARNPDGGPTREAVYRLRGLTASYLHSYFASNPRATAALFGSETRV